MAKKKPLNEGAVNIDNCLSIVLDGAKTEFGDDKVFTGAESEVRLVGIYLPSLSLRYLYQSNIMPLSRMELIVGTQASCKSAFLYEKYRWIRANGGKSYHIENESKDSDTLRMSINKHDRQAVELLVSESLEDWQKQLTYLLRKDTVKAALLGSKDKPGPGKTVPIGFGVDSLTAKASMEIQDAMDKRGFADRAHPVDALKISSYLKCMPQKLVDWPFWFGAINHLKPQKGPTGAIMYNVPGGYSVKFQETFETRLAHVADISNVEEQGATIKMVTQKNSLGPGRKSIMADFKWYFDSSGLQHSYWDWHGATVKLLDTQLKGSLRTDAMDIVDFRVVTRGGGKRVWSKALNIPSEDPQTFQVAGALLESRPDLLLPLHRLLGVREYTVFKQGVDYSTQLREAVVGIEQANGYAPAYQDGELPVGDEDAPVEYTEDE